MRTARFHETDEPLILEDLPVPHVSLDEVLVRVEACGICHTDLSILEGLLPPSRRPITLGHEASGTVSEIGEQVKQFDVGERVIVNCFASRCGLCHHCQSGRTNLCPDAKILGLDLDGAFAEYVKVPEQGLVKLPEDIPLRESAVIADAISTPVHSIMTVGHVSPEDVIAIFGIGGLGINAVQIGAAFASEVIAIDLVDWKLEAAMKLGATRCVNAAEENSVKELRKMTEGVGVDAAFDFSGTTKAFSDAFWSVKDGGRVIVTALGLNNLDMSLLPLVRKEISITGSYGYTEEDVTRAIHLTQQGHIKLDPTITHMLPLEQVNDGLELVMKGKTLRAIVLPQ